MVIDLLADMGAHMARLEAKVDGMPTHLSAAPEPGPTPNGLEIPGLPTHSPYGIPETGYKPVSSPHSTRHTATTPGNSAPLSFSAHQTIQWPSIRSLIMPDVAQRYPESYHSQLELARPRLGETQRHGPAGLEADWLSTLSVACVQELCNAYFDTFNRVYPLLDRDHFFLHTLGHVVRQGFAQDPEACVVLNVMALGSMGLRAYTDGEFHTHPQRHHVYDTESLDFAQTLFAEALARSGPCLVSHDIQSCQYYMTSAVFFLQTMRPADMWLMLNRGATLLTALLQHQTDDGDEWAADLRSRVFWSSLSLEAVVVQEFEYLPSRLNQWEEITPLPKFVCYPLVQRSRMRDNPTDDSHYQYHFLAQVAHRIILSRIREELFNSNPSVAVATELRHQIEQWRASLPMPILERADFEHKTAFSCPADVMTAALLRTRYCVGIYHLGRPFCYKAIHQPDATSDAELAICGEALQMANEWPMASALMMGMSTFTPLKLFCAGQMLGQLLIMYAFQHSPDSRVRAAVPVHHRATCDMMLRYMASLKDESPTVAMDYELVSSLFEPASSD